MPLPATPRSLRRAVTAVLVVAGLGLAGCSGGSSAGDDVAASGSGSPASSATSASSTPSGARSTPARGGSAGTTTPAAAATTLPGMPPVLDPRNVYAADAPGHLAAATKGALPLVYVPNGISNTVDVIDQRTYRIVRTIPVGRLPQHVVPSYDLRWLWVTDDLSNDLVKLDPRTGKAVGKVPVLDPYNLYFTPNGRYAMVMAEAHQLIDFRYPQTMRLHKRLYVGCKGVDHGDFTADGRYFLASCEFAGKLVVIDVAHLRVARYVSLGSASYAPQDVKLSPDGRTFFVADMHADGVWKVDARTWRVRGLLHTGRGAHGLYVSRDSKTLYVTNRDEGSVGLISLATGRVTGTWHIPPSPNGAPASPDMGNINAAGTVLWLSGRYSSEVYALDTRTGKLLARIHTGTGPHGLCVWPQPGRYSLGHTGILR